MKNSMIPTLYSRIESEIGSYTTDKVEVSKGVFFSQYKTITRIYKFKNRDLSGSKLNADLSYNYYFDIISPRVDSEVKNLRFDTKNILLFSQNPRKDFSAVFLANASLKKWMSGNGNDEKLKAVVEEFTQNGNVGFKRVRGGYDTVDPLNTYITNQRAESIDETDIIERHEMTASQIKAMTEWEHVDEVIAELGNKSFSATRNTTTTTTTAKKYEIYEYTGEVSEKEFNQCKGLDGGEEHEYFLAKVIVAGMNSGGKGEKYTLFAERLKGKLSDHYIYAHRGSYQGRFWRVGMFELLFDHQIRANEIGNQLSSGLEWASKVIFRSKDSKVLQNIRADMDNGDIVITDDLSQVDVRMRGLDQLIADWNRLLADADRLSNSLEVVRGENLPSGTPFRMGLLLDQNAGKMFTFLRQKITLPYKRVFKDWVLPELVKDMKAKDVFRLVGETDIIEQLQDILVDTWYANNLVKIGPHTQDIADGLKQAKKAEFLKLDPVIENSRELWEGVLSRLFITITGENSDVQDQIQDLISLIQYEQDPARVNWILDTIYKARGIPIPPPQEVKPEQGSGALQQAMKASTNKPGMQDAKQPVIQ